MYIENRKKEGFFLVQNLIVDGVDFFVPSSIFRNRHLSVFESIVKHLKDDQNLVFHQIAVLLNRDERNIWTVYNRARKKSLRFDVKLEQRRFDFLIPVSIFQDRRVAVLEALVVYLHDFVRIKYHDLGTLLGRDERTIWTAYNRGKTKLNEREL